MEIGHKKKMTTFWWWTGIFYGFITLQDSVIRKRRGAN